MSATAIFLNILFLIIGFVILVKGADWFVDGASMLAKKLGIPSIVVGLTIVAMGTSLPEAAVGITASIGDSSSLAIGNVLGSNIANILLVLGLCAILQPLSIKKNTLWIEIPFVILITVVVLLLGYFDGGLSRLDGGILIALFVLFFVYLIISVKKGKGTDLIDGIDDESEKKPKSWWLLILMIVVGAVMIIFGSNFVVDTASALAKNWGMSEEFVGLTIVAFGTSLPELATTVAAARKKEADLAIGNIIGSNIFNILFVLGLTSLIKPLVYDSGFLIDNLIAIGVALFLWLAIFINKDKKLKRWGGIIMLVGYISYFVYLIVARMMA